MKNIAVLILFCFAIQCYAGKIYLVQNPPRGSTLNVDTGEFNWVPDSNQVGIYDVNFWTVVEVNNSLDLPILVVRQFQWRIYVKELHHNFKDFCLFANQWKKTVGLTELRVLSQDWLKAD
jgi:hypothetical protein